jgi:hypothetical protein
MSTFCFTGRHLSWLACSLLILHGSAAAVLEADDLPESQSAVQISIPKSDPVDARESDSNAAHAALQQSVNAELLDLARAFRGLDQSYQYRGMKSRLASTAGSAFVDWDAKGIAPEHRHPVSAPSPVLVGCAADECECGSAPGPHGLCRCGRQHAAATLDGSCSATGSAGAVVPLHSSGSNCAATIGVPLHPSCNDCRATIGIPLHPHAASHDAECASCAGQAVDGLIHAGHCEDCFVVEQYRDGQLIRTKVPCDRCKSGLTH